MTASHSFRIGLIPVSMNEFEVDLVHSRHVARMQLIVLEARFIYKPASQAVPLHSFILSFLVG